MRLVSFVAGDGAARVGMLSPDLARVADLTAIGLEDVYAAVPRLQQLGRLTAHLTQAPGAVAYPVGNVRLLAPVPYARIVRDTPIPVATGGGAARETPPLLFADPAEIGGPGTHVVCASGEVLAVGVAAAIGSGGRDIPAAGAAAHVAGLTLVAEWHDPWSAARRAGAIVMGPSLAGIDVYDEAERLTLSAPDGAVRHASIEGALDAIARMIAIASTRYTLRPGDIFLHLAGVADATLAQGDRGEFVVESEWSGALAHTAYRSS